MRITTIGEILIDMTEIGKDENGIPRFQANPGGAPANVAVAAAKLGCKSSFIGCVGEDAFGAFLRETLNRWNVDASGLQMTTEASTTLAVVTVDESGERSFSFCRKPGADTCIDTAKAIQAAVSAGILHFGSVSLTDPTCRDTIISVVKAAKANGAIITYDPNYRAALWENESTAMPIIRSVLPLCDIVKISDEEAMLLCGVASPHDAAQHLIDLGIKLAVVTLGANGALWRFGTFEGKEPGFPVQVADTNGAGDTFFGAFLSRIAQNGGLDGLTSAKIASFVRFANKAAFLTTSRSGAIPAMPTLTEMEEFDA